MSDILIIMSFLPSLLIPFNVFIPASKGSLYGSHFCYLMAQVPFGTFDKKSCKLVLIGSSHSLAFTEFASNEAIQCTEIYEYALSLANPAFSLINFQLYKYLMATRLVDYGMPETVSNMFTVCRLMTH